MGDCKNDEKQEIVLNLANNLEIHHLDVTPDQDQLSIEFELHATLQNVSEAGVEALTYSQLTMEELVCSVTGAESG